MIVREAENETVSGDTREMIKKSGSHISLLIATCASLRSTNTRTHHAYVSLSITNTQALRGPRGSCASQQFVLCFLFPFAFPCGAYWITDNSTSTSSFCHHFPTHTFLPTNPTSIRVFFLLHFFSLSFISLPLPNHTSHISNLFYPIFFHFGPKYTHLHDSLPVTWD